MKEKIKQFLIKAKTRLVISHLVTFLYLMMATGTVSPILGHLTSGQFTEADAVRMSVLAWIGVAYANHRDVMRKQDAIDQVVEAADHAVNHLTMELTAVGNSYNNLVETMDRLDKRVLRKHGISVNVVRKEKTIN